MLELLAQATQPSTTVWTNLTPEKIIAYGAVAAGVWKAFSSGWDSLYDWITSRYFGARKKWIEQEAELERLKKQLQALAAVSPQTNVEPTAAAIAIVKQAGNEAVASGIAGVGAGDPMQVRT